MEFRAMKTNKNISSRKVPSTTPKSSSNKNRDRRSPSVISTVSDASILIANDQNLKEMVHQQKLLHEQQQTQQNAHQLLRSFKTDSLDHEIHQQFLKHGLDNDVAKSLWRTTDIPISAEGHVRVDGVQSDDCESSDKTDEAGYMYSAAEHDVTPRTMPVRNQRPPSTDLARSSTLLSPITSSSSQQYQQTYVHETRTLLHDVSAMIPDPSALSNEALHESFMKFMTEMQNRGMVASLPVLPIQQQPPIPVGVAVRVSGSTPDAVAVNGARTSPATALVNCGSGSVSRSTTPGLSGSSATTAVESRKHVKRTKSGGSEAAMRAQSPYTVGGSPAAAAALTVVANGSGTPRRSGTGTNTIPPPSISPAGRYGHGVPGLIHNGSFSTEPEDAEIKDAFLQLVRGSPSGSSPAIAAGTPSTITAVGNAIWTTSRNPSRGSGAVPPSEELIEEYRRNCVSCLPNQQQPTSMNPTPTLATPKFQKALEPDSGPSIRSSLSAGQPVRQAAGGSGLLEAIVQNRNIGQHPSTSVPSSRSVGTTIPSKVDAAQVEDNFDAVKLAGSLDKLMLNGQQTCTDLKHSVKSAFDDCSVGSHSLNSGRSGTAKQKFSPMFC